MKCPSYDERISSFLDDAMPVAERAAFESELLDNAELRQQVLELRQLRQDVAALPRYSVREGFAQRVVAAAVAAKADKDAQITLPARPKTIRRVAISGLAIAASVAILVGSLIWINNRGPVDVATNGNNGKIEQPENPLLTPVFAALPNADEALVLRIKAPKDAAIGTLLRESLAEQGIMRRAPGDPTTVATAVGNTYRKQIGNDRKNQKRAADALYLEISPEELELVLSRIAEPTPELKFVPEQRLAVTKPAPANAAVAGNNVVGTNTAAAESIEGNPATAQAASTSAEFVQDLNPGMFRLPDASGDSPEHATTHVPAPTATPPGRVRVLILIENVE